MTTNPGEKQYNYDEVKRRFYDDYLESVPGVNRLLSRPGVDKAVFQAGKRDCKNPRTTIYSILNLLTWALVLYHALVYVYNVQYYGWRSVCKDFTIYRQGKLEVFACQKNMTLSDFPRLQQRSTMMQNLRGGNAENLQEETDAKTNKEAQKRIQYHFAYQMTGGLVLIALNTLIMLYHIRRCNAGYGVLYSFVFSFVYHLIELCVFSLFISSADQNNDIFSHVLFT